MLIRFTKFQSSSCARGIGQRDHDCLAYFVQAIVNSIDADNLPCLTGVKSQHARLQRVVHTTAGGRTTCHSIVHGVSLARLRKLQHCRKLGRTCTFKTTRRCRLETHRGRKTRAENEAIQKCLGSFSCFALGGGKVSDRDIAAAGSEKDGSRILHNRVILVDAVRLGNVGRPGNPNTLNMTEFWICIRMVMVAKQPIFCTRCQIAEGNDEVAIRGAYLIIREQEIPFNILQRSWRSPRLRRLSAVTGNRVTGSKGHIDTGTAYIGGSTAGINCGPVTLENATSANVTLHYNPGTGPVNHRQLRSNKN